jgi:hypothetical protein
MLKLCDIYLFNDIFYVAMNGEVISVKWIGKDLDGSIRGLISDNISVFDWRG